MNKIMKRLKITLFSLLLLFGLFAGLRPEGLRIAGAHTVRATSLGDLLDLIWTGEDAEPEDDDSDDAQAPAGNTGSDDEQSPAGNTDSDDEEVTVYEDGTYTSKEEVAAYLNQFGHLPENYITKKEAKKLGWVSSEGNLNKVAPGKSIGGDYFGNYEELLPVKKGRSYYECDIDFTGGRRNAKRIIYSDDGLIYYTDDHYETFELLYGEE